MFAKAKTTPKVAFTYLSRLSQNQMYTWASRTDQLQKKQNKRVNDFKPCQWSTLPSKESSHLLEICYLHTAQPYHEIKLKHIERCSLFHLSSMQAFHNNNFISFTETSFSRESIITGPTGWEGLWITCIQLENIKNQCISSLITDPQSCSTEFLSLRPNATLWKPHPSWIKGA